MPKRISIATHLDIACEFGLSTNKHIILVIDRAGWHSSKNLEIPEGLHL